MQLIAVSAGFGVWGALCNELQLPGTFEHTGVFLIMQIVPSSMMQVKEIRMVMSLLLLYSMGASAAPATTRSVAPDPPVRVWFNSDGNYQYGDRAKVYAKAAEDGNLVVLRADAGGQVRVLFRSIPTAISRSVAARSTS